MTALDVDWSIIAEDTAHYFVRSSILTWSSICRDISGLSSNIVYWHLLIIYINRFLFLFGHLVGMWCYVRIGWLLMMLVDLPSVCCWATKGRKEFGCFYVWTYFCEYLAQIWSFWSLFWKFVVFSTTKYYLWVNTYW